VLLVAVWGEGGVNWGSMDGVCCQGDRRPGVLAGGEKKMRDRQQKGGSREGGQNKCSGAKAKDGGGRVSGSMLGREKTWRETGQREALGGCHETGLLCVIICG